MSHISAGSPEGSVPLANSKDPKRSAPRAVYILIQISKYIVICVHTHMRIYNRYSTEVKSPYLHTNVEDIIQITLSSALCLLCPDCYCWVPSCSGGLLIVHARPCSLFYVPFLEMFIIWSTNALCAIYLCPFRGLPCLRPYCSVPPCLPWSILHYGFFFNLLSTVTAMLLFYVLRCPFTGGTERVHAMHLHC